MSTTLIVILLMVVVVLITRLLQRNSLLLQSEDRRKELSNALQCALEEVDHLRTMVDQDYLARTKSSMKIHG